MRGYDDGITADAKGKGEEQKKKGAYKGAYSRKPKKSVSEQDFEKFCFVYDT